MSTIIILTFLDVPILRNRHHLFDFRWFRCVDDYQVNVDDPDHPVQLKVECNWNEKWILFEIYPHTNTYLHLRKGMLSDIQMCAGSSIFMIWRAIEIMWIYIRIVVGCKFNQYYSTNCKFTSLILRLLENSNDSLIISIKKITHNLFKSKFI